MSTSNTREQVGEMQQGSVQEGVAEMAISEATELAGGARRKRTAARGRKGKEKEMGSLEEEAEQASAPSAALGAQRASALGKKRLTEGKKEDVRKAKNKFLR